MCNDPRFYPDIVDPRTGKMIPCPCHKCSGCRIDRITLWDRRITSEYVKTRSSFVTLTYNDYFLPYNPGSVFPTVRRQDLSRFLDNLRHFVHSIPDEVFPSMCSKNYKVVACSEYGENGTRRPHYHIIFLGLDWHNFRQVFIKKWPKGIVDVGPLRTCVPVEFVMFLSIFLSSSFPRKLFKIIFVSAVTFLLCRFLPELERIFLFLRLTISRNMAWLKSVIDLYLFLAIGKISFLIIVIRMFISFLKVGINILSSLILSVVLWALIPMILTSVKLAKLLSILMR